MRVETRLFGYLVIFFLIVTPIYGFWTKWQEPIGPVALFLTGLLCALIAFYLGVTARKYRNRPEDDPMGEIADQVGDYGFFTPYSWWPLWLAGSAAITMMGLAVGWWLFMIGVVFGVVAVVGWTFEHYKGDYAN